MPETFPGVRFVPTSFTPNASNYSGQKCGGVNFVLLDRNALDAPELGIELAAALHKLYPDQFHLEKIVDLLLNQSVYDALAKGQDPRRIAQDWQESLDKFHANPAKVPHLQVIRPLSFFPRDSAALLAKI